MSGKIENMDDENNDKTLSTAEIDPFKIAQSSVQIICPKCQIEVKTRVSVQFGQGGIGRFCGCLWVLKFIVITNFF